MEWKLSEIYTRRVIYEPVKSWRRIYCRSLMNIHPSIHRRRLLFLLVVSTLSRPPKTPTTLIDGSSIVTLALMWNLSSLFVVCLIVVLLLLFIRKKKRKKISIAMNIHSFHSTHPLSVSLFCCCSQFDWFAINQFLFYVSSVCHSFNLSWNEVWALGRELKYVDMYEMSQLHDTNFNSKLLQRMTRQGEGFIRSMRLIEC